MPQSIPEKPVPAMTKQAFERSFLQDLMKLDVPVSGLRARTAEKLNYVHALTSSCLPLDAAIQVAKLEHVKTHGIPQAAVALGDAIYEGDDEKITRAQDAFAQEIKDVTTGLNAAREVAKKVVDLGQTRINGEGMVR